eukprot:1159144-Pelagomonas_calceolata.AAC.13
MGSPDCALTLQPKDCAHAYMCCMTQQSSAGDKGVTELCCPSRADAEADAEAPQFSSGHTAWLSWSHCFVQDSNLSNPPGTSAAVLCPPPGEQGGPFSDRSLLANQEQTNKYGIIVNRSTIIDKEHMSQ